MDVNSQLNSMRVLTASSRESSLRSLRASHSPFFFFQAFLSHLSDHKLAQNRPKPTPRKVAFPRRDVAEAQGETGKVLEICSEERCFKIVKVERPVASWIFSYGTQSLLYSFVREYFLCD